MESSPFAFLIRSMHIAPRRGLEDDSKEVFYDCEVETCVFDPECGVGMPKFCAACGEVEHVVHGCALLDLGRMCMDGREAQTCDTQVEQVGKSKQTHEPCVALDLALPIRSECVRDESLELERCVEGSFAASEPSSPTDGHRRAGCGLFELLTPVMLLTETQLRDAVIGFISAVLAVVSCSFAWIGKLGRCLRNAGLSCRRVWNLRPRKPKKSERRLSQISLWLKLAVFFALFVGAAGANNGFKSYDVRRDGSDPFSWTATGSLAAAVPDDGTCRRQGIPGPIRQCWPGCKASVEGFRRSVPGEGAFGTMAGWAGCRGTGAYNWATYFEEPWKVGSGYMAKFGDVNETGKECVGQPPVESYHKCWHGLPYLQKSRITSTWLGQSNVANRRAEEVVSDIFACDLNGRRGAARCWKETAYICWNG